MGSNLEPIPVRAVPTISMPVLLALLGWPLLVAGLGATWATRTADAHIAARLDETPPKVAVIDVAAFVREAGNGDGAPDAKLDRGLKQASEAAEKLRAAGYVVVDRRYVLSAPEELLVRPK